VDSFKSLSLESFYENKYIQSIVVEDMSMLERIESEAFKKTGLNFMTVPDSVVFLGVECSCKCKSLSSITFESGP
jgi:hypothetical protein